MLMILNIKKIHLHLKHNSIHDEYDTSENQNTIEIDTFKQYGEKIHETEESLPTETSQVLTVFNKGIHHVDDHQMTNLRLKLNHQRKWGARNWKTGQTPYYQIPN